MSLVLRQLALAPFLVLAACNVNVNSNLPPQPPMWIVSDADSEITLYPTLHILPEGIDWKSKELTRRLAVADEVWFEIMPGSETDPALQVTMMRLGMAPGTSLSDQLTEDEIKALKLAIEPMGLPYVAANSMRPWLVTTIVSVGALVDKGFDPNSGVEKQLQPMVKGKKIRALETAEEQMKMLASIPLDMQMEMLRESLTEMDETVEDLRDLVNDWAVGDVEDLEDDLIEEMKSEMPAAYNIVFTDRNRNWVDQIEIEMKGSGTDFIAVGAGHLVGDDSVPAMLKARGYTVERL